VKNSTHSTSKRVLNFSLLFVALIAVFWPLEAPEFDYTWKPTASNNQIRIPLIEQKPDFFKMTFDCQIGIERQDWVVNSEGGTPFQVTLTKEFVVIITKNIETQELNNLYFERSPTEENCVSSLTFSENTWTLNDFGKTLSKKNPADSLFNPDQILTLRP
jgi:hypothetical protein